jgi:hypothetical protein
MVHTEDRIVVGKIYTQGLALDLLNLEPNYAIPVKLREHVFVFQVVDVEGFQKTLLVSKGDFAILLSEPELKPVKYMVEEGEHEGVLMTFSISESVN